MMRPAAYAAVVMCLLACLLLAFMYPRNRSAAAGPEDTRKPVCQWPAVAALSESDWSVFKSSSTSQPKQGHFRLAGTFFVYQADGSQVRKAILDDLQTKGQNIVTEGDKLGTVEVVSILLDRIVLREGATEETLFLTPSEAGGEKPVTAGTGMDWLKLSGNETIIATNYYGAQVGENRWVMSRERVLDYCKQMEDRPARMQKLFDSMKPVYAPGPQGRRVIRGYHLEIEGEADFYRDMGLKQGDTVRRVNDVEMTGKNRAMRWIHDFINDRANVFVLDIERDGKQVQLQYEIR